MVDVTQRACKRFSFRVAPSLIQESQGLWHYGMKIKTCLLRSYTTRIIDVSFPFHVHVLCSVYLPSYLWLLAWYRFRKKDSGTSRNAFSLLLEKNGYLPSIDFEWEHLMERHSGRSQSSHAAVRDGRPFAQALRTLLLLHLVIFLKCHLSHLVRVIGTKYRTRARTWPFKASATAIKSGNRKTKSQDRVWKFFW